jgi:hypothetical protein
LKAKNYQHQFSALFLMPGLLVLSGSLIRADLPSLPSVLVLNSKAAIVIQVSPFHWYIGVLKVFFSGNSQQKKYIS